MSQGKPKDFQRTVELINKYLLNSTQFMNRFVATVDVKLGRASRQLQRLESQVTLLEKKLDSIDSDGAPTARGDEQAMGTKMPLQITGPPAADAPSPTAAAGTVSNLPPGVQAPTAGGSSSPPPPKRSKVKGNPPLPPGVQASAQNVPPPMQNGGRGPVAPPPPGAKMPPLPPGVSAPSGGGPAPLALMPPPMTANGAPPPPPPMAAAAGTATRNHPRLAGYFKMADAGVPVVAIKQKMKSDGHNPDWFDSPDAAAPLPKVKPSSKPGADYDSD